MSPNWNIFMMMVAKSWLSNSIIPSVILLYGKSFIFSSLISSFIYVNINIIIYFDAQIVQILSVGDSSSWHLCLFYFLFLTELCLFKIHDEVLTPNVTVFGDKAFEDLIKVKWGHKGRTLIQKDL